MKETLNKHGIISDNAVSKTQFPLYLEILIKAKKKLL
jgi:hypothetical protein